MASRPIRKRCFQRLNDALTPESAIKIMRWQTEDAQEGIILQTLSVLSSLALVDSKCDPEEVGLHRAAHNTRLLWDMTTSVAAELFVRCWPSSCQWPGVVELVVPLLSMMLVQSQPNQLLQLQLLHLMLLLL